MKEIHHLTLHERETIQTTIEEGKTKAEIGRLLQQFHKRMQKRNPDKIAGDKAEDAAGAGAQQGRQRSIQLF